MDKNGTINVLCTCHGQQKMAAVRPGVGIEMISRHHGTYHIGSLSVRELLMQISGTTDGSAITEFVRGQVATLGLA
mgnify:CR=1 FL=1